MNIFLPISFNIHFGHSKEMSHLDGSFCTHNICLVVKQENLILLHTLTFYYTPFDILKSCNLKVKIAIPL